MRKRYRSLRGILIFGLLLAVIFPVFLFGYFGIMNLTAGMEKEITDKNYLLARSLASETGRFLDEQRKLLMEIRGSLEKKHIKPNSINDYLETLVFHNKLFDMIRILDHDGKIVFLTPYDTNYLGLNMAGHDYYRIPKTHNTLFWSPTFISIQTGNPTLTLSLPFRNGVIVGHINLNTANTIIEKVRIGERGIATIIDSGGTVIAHREKKYIIQRVNFKNMLPVKMGLEGHQGVFRYEYDGNMYLGSVAAVQHTGWIVTVVQPIEEAFSPVVEIRNMIIAGTISAIVLSFIVVITGLKITLRPLDKFAEDSEKIAHGNYNLEIDPPRYTELQNLADNFHIMAEAVEQREKELRRLRNYLANIINSMPSVLVGVDSHGRVTQWNKTAEQTTGIAADTAQGKPLSSVFPRMASEMTKITESIRTRQTKQERNRFRLSGTNTGYEDVTIYPLITNGAEGAVIRIDDVTGKVRMEEMMIQSEKMLSVGGLAAGMAHEINNPLAGMMQTADVMSKRLTNIEMPANLRAAEDIGITMNEIKAFMEIRGILPMINTIKESGQRVAGIVNNMLSFARKSDAAKPSYDLAEIVNKSLELARTDYDLKKQHDFKTIEIIEAYDDNLPMVFCEGSKIQQVLINVLRNAAQAMQEAGTKNPQIIVRTRLEKQRKMACIEIQDNGPGMDEETRKRIFEPFFSTKPMGIGTGLGLSVSYFIITENHNGEMIVESTPGSGAKFIIRLPLSDDNAEV